nr:MAG TPA: hypothetical protein [Caudoviricetes sp.]
MIPKFSTINSAYCSLSYIILLTNFSLRKSGIF